MNRWKVQGLFMVAALVVAVGTASAAEPTARAIFNERLMPIFKSPNPSSCVQCHLAGVDLKDYILPDHERTFRSLRDQGLIDVASPEKSKILALIKMGSTNKAGADLIPMKTRQVEYEAFAAWIKSCSDDSVLRSSPKLDEKERASPAKPPEVIRHARKDRLLESFERNVWALRFRCMNCHTEATPQCEKHVKEHGVRVAWFKKEGPEATMDYLIAGKFLDLNEPSKSLLLRKPLGELDHGGGIKFQVGDQGYKAMRSWIEDVAAIRGGRYVRAADLPKDDGVKRFGTDIWLKLTDTPPAWADQLLQVSIFSWNQHRSQWDAEPIATSDRLVFGRGKVWQHNLTLMAARDSALARTWTHANPELPPGRYLVKVFVDRDGRMAKNWNTNIGTQDLVGQAEINAGWPTGYGRMTVINANQVKK